MPPPQKTILTGRTFTLADLAQLPLENAEFEDCTFGKLSLGGAAWKRCRFFDCHFDQCDLSLAKVVDCAFARTRFSGCRLTGINWSEAEKLERVAFGGSQLNDATFIHIDVDHCDFSECVARRASFRDLRARSAQFRNADLEDTEFVNTDLRESDFRGASGYVISPRENKLEKARFSLPEATRLLAGLGIVLS